MAPKSVQTASEMLAGDPKHAARATRTAGRQMRSRLLDGASGLFKERGLAGTSISDIAAAADAFPSQITYYFRTKEALFVEAACRDVLYVARAAEQAATQAHTPLDYTRALVETVTATDSVAFFTEALTLTRRRQDLGAAGGAHHRAAARRGDARLCRPDRTARLANPARSRCELARRFWALAIGVMVEGHAMGRSAEEMCAEMLRVLGDQATAATVDDSTRLRLVGDRDASDSEFAGRGEIIMTALRMRARDFLNEDQLTPCAQRVDVERRSADRACVGGDLGRSRWSRGGPIR